MQIIMRCNSCGRGRGRVAFSSGGWWLYLSVLFIMAAFMGTHPLARSPPPIKGAPTGAPGRPGQLGACVGETPVSSVTSLEQTHAGTDGQGSGRGRVGGPGVGDENLELSLFRTPMHTNPSRATAHAAACRLRGRHSHSRGTLLKKLSCPADHPLSGPKASTPTKAHSAILIVRRPLVLLSTTK
jgi:hypothetical protein